MLGTLIAALEQSHSDVLITGDKALLALADRYPIRTPFEFWAAHARTLNPSVQLDPRPGRRADEMGIRRQRGLEPAIQGDLVHLVQ